ncbi:hypothetical protein HBN50_16190 [Halobacteriovorax sp. GB3]|uniref:hypothetical protein n=1 Tax=Halobacteriovorax sp. GB3 TaxID=2719615 RepID=UPI00235E8765|nr:hypothetical protein [Halobacteriovorax sp. GB3]MDD0854654.1 hypothetical protein [Halobacteriovorax sp. GB3]
MNKDQLQNMMNEIMEKEAPKKAIKSKAAREILNIERELRDSGVAAEFDVLISELIPEKANDKFGNGGFPRDKYSLSWKVLENGPFRLFLTNVQYNNSKLLIECPESFQDDTFKYLNRFVTMMAQSFNDKLKNVVIEDTEELEEE